jgi:hypothetical protein
MGVSGHSHAKAMLLPPEIGPWVPTGQEAGWASEPVWPQRLEEKSFCLWHVSNLNHPVIQSVIRHYTDYATLAPDEFLRAIKIRSTPSLGEEVWPDAPCCKILRYVNLTCKYEQKYFARPNFHSFCLLSDDCW